MGEDFRLNYRLEHACSRDVGNLCGKDVCDQGNEISCGGRVLRCLVDKKEQIVAESCKQEVFYFIKMEVLRVKPSASFPPIHC
jgi:golgi apparatus protein 1